MPNTDAPLPFRLSTGGLFYSLFLRVRLLAEDEYRSRRLIVLFVALAWVPLIVFSALGNTLVGNQTELSLLGDLKPHVRCLMVIPLLVLARNVIDPIISGAISGFRESGILADDDRHKFDAALDELERRRDSYGPDIVLLVVTAALTWSVIMGLADVGFEDDTNSWMKTDPGSGASFTVAGWWYLLVSSPILQILLYRWLWRFAIWAGFLYRFSRIKLVLEPAHPDLAGGLGVLKYTQGAFTVIFVAFGAMISVAIAQEIIQTDLTLSQVRPLIIGFIIAAIALDSLPLAFFTSQLIDARRRGRRAYGALAHKQTRAFDAGWIDKDKESIGEDLMHAVDPSAMADYSAVYENVKSMYVVPASLRHYTLQAAILAVPFLPLILIEVPISDLLGRLLDSLV